MKNLLADFQALGFDQVKLILDRGFYSETNINGLFKAHLKFIVAVQTGVSFVRNAIDTVYNNLHRLRTLMNNMICIQALSWLVAFFRKT